VFKNLIEWKKFEVVKFDFCTDFLINSTDFLLNSADFSVNSTSFLEIGSDRSHQNLTIFRKTCCIFKTKKRPPGQTTTDEQANQAANQSFWGKCHCSRGPAAAPFLLYFLPGSIFVHVLLTFELLQYFAAADLLCSLLLVLVALTTIVLLKGGGFSSDPAVVYAFSCAHA
jgi:hypothetical protein